MISGYIAITVYLSYAAGIQSDVLAALCVLIAAAALLLLLRNGCAGIGRFYYNIFGISDPSTVILLDIVTHYVPVLLLGLPSDPFSYVYAYLMLMVYYILVRNRLNAIYFGIVSPDWVDPLMLWTGAIIFLIPFIK
jgi:hypothetical protein